MKKVIITNEKTIDDINHYVKYINNEIKNFASYLRKQNLNENIEGNIKIYSENIISSCKMINLKTLIIGD